MMIVARCLMDKGEVVVEEEEKCTNVRMQCHFYYSLKYTTCMYYTQFTALYMHIVSAHMQSQV